jgi:hypothetical protein
MTTETNKRLVEDFFSKVSNGDLEGAFTLIHEDLAWWSAGGENLAFSGVLTKPAFIQSMRGMGEIFAQGLTLSPTSMTAEDDRVAVELSGQAVLKDGRAYENLYHILITFRDGQIIAAREYHDTLYAKIVLIDQQVSKSPV